MANESKEAIKLMKDNGCDVLDIKFIDLPGVWQHVSVPISEVNDGLFANGTGFDGSSIRGFQSIDESDMLLVPDQSTVKIDPFVDGQVTVIDLEAQRGHGCTVDASTVASPTGIGIPGAYIPFILPLGRE